MRLDGTEFPAGGVDQPSVAAEAPAPSAGEKHSRTIKTSARDSTHGATDVPGSSGEGGATQSKKPRGGSGTSHQSTRRGGGPGARKTADKSGSKAKALQGEAPPSGHQGKPSSKRRQSLTAQEAAERRAEGAKGGVGGGVWKQAFPSLGLNIGKLSAENDAPIHVGRALLDQIAESIPTVNDNKGFESQESKGYSNRSWNFWMKHVLIPLEASFRSNKKVNTWFKAYGGTRIWLDKGSFVTIQKYVASQKTQFSKAKKKENRGTGSAAESDPKPQSALCQARQRIWGSNPACSYPSQTYESGGLPAESCLSPASSRGRAGGGGTPVYDVDENSSYGVQEVGLDIGAEAEEFNSQYSDEDGGLSDSEAEKGFSQSSPPRAERGGVGDQPGGDKGKGKPKAGRTPPRNRGRGGHQEKRNQQLERFGAGSIADFARGSGSSQQKMAATVESSAGATNNLLGAILALIGGGSGIGGGAAAGDGVAGGAVGGVSGSHRQNMETIASEQKTLELLLKIQQQKPDTKGIDDKIEKQMQKLI